MSDVQPKVEDVPIHPGVSTPYSQWRKWAAWLGGWTGTTMLGGSFAYLIIYWFAIRNKMSFEHTLQFAAPLAGGLAGLLIGSLQQQMLHRRVRVGFSWSLATGLGLALGLPVVIGISGWVSSMRDDLSDWDALLAFLGGAALAGLVAGLPQWIILSGKVARAGWLLVGSSVGALMGWLASLALAWELLAGSSEQGIQAAFESWPVGLVMGAAAGGLIGLETGIALVGMIAQQAWEKRRDERYPSSRGGM